MQRLIKKPKERDWMTSEQHKEKRRQYYEKNRYRLCDYSLNYYSPKAIGQIVSICPDTVNEYYSLYPFEEYGEPFIKKRLSGYRVFSHQARYQDCYDAGMLAYLFSIHRCAFLHVENVTAYINKMIRIYVICALVLCDDAKNLCRTNGLKEVRIDAY